MNGREDYPRVFLKKGRELSIRRFHPWVFSGAIERKDGVSQGCPVEVCTHTGEYLASGHYSAGGSIAVKLLSWERTKLDGAFYAGRLRDALALRSALGFAPETDAFRLVNAEGDGLPGLIVDIYGRAAAVEIQSAGMSAARQVICSALDEVLNPDTIYVRDSVLEERLFAKGAQTEGVVLENGSSFKVNWESGQKTGFFLDQRDNRKLLSTLTKGSAVLNAFCYTGGFSVFAARGGASLVDSVDSSKAALELLQVNMRLNGLNTPGEVHAADCFDFLKQIGGRYDVIVLDPPAFVKHQSAVEGGLKGYRSLNALAARQVRKGGLIFTFSCSQLVGREAFKKAVLGAAQSSGRRAQIMYELHAAADHPISLYHPEGEYLKGFVIRME